MSQTEKTKEELMKEARRAYVRARKAARTPEQIEKDRAYRREWNHKNADKVKAATERFYMKKAAEYNLRGDI